MRQKVVFCLNSGRTLLAQLQAAQGNLRTRKSQVRMCSSCFISGELLAAVMFCVLSKKNTTTNNKLTNKWGHCSVASPC